MSAKPATRRTGQVMRAAKWTPSKYGAHLSAAARFSGFCASTIRGHPLWRPSWRKPSRSVIAGTKMQLREKCPLSPVSMSPKPPPCDVPE